MSGQVASLAVGGLPLGWTGADPEHRIEPAGAGDTGHEGDDGHEAEDWGRDGWERQLAGERGERHEPGERADDDADVLVERTDVPFHASAVMYVSPKTVLPGVSRVTAFDGDDAKRTPRPRRQACESWQDTVTIRGAILVCHGVVDMSETTLETIDELLEGLMDNVETEEGRYKLRSARQLLLVVQQRHDDVDEVLEDAVGDETVLENLRDLGYLN